MKLTKFSVLSAIAAGSLMLAAGAATASASTTQPATRTTLTSQVRPSAGTAGAAGVTTRRAHSFFGSRACIAGYCAPLGQSWLWYDSTDPAGRNLSRIQLNWADPERPCGTWIDFDAWSSSGTQRYWHIQGTNTGCKVRNGVYALNNGADYIPANVQSAVVCGTLYRTGNPAPKLVTRTCVDGG